MRRYFMILQNFRLTLNHHYMTGWILAAYFLAAHKHMVIKALLVSMYFWAGILKILSGSGWMAGGALYGRRPLGLPESLVPLACSYVIVLELVLVFGLISRRPWVFWAALAQVHIASFWVVGFFYPLLMFMLLSEFVIDRTVPSDLPVRVAQRRVGIVAVVLWVSALSVAQLSTFGCPGDSSITGEGRLFALNMFDAPMECRATGTAHPLDRPMPPAFPIKVPFANTRVHCDPILFLALATDYCKRHSGDFDLHLESRKHSSDPFRTVVLLKSVCSVEAALFTLDSTTGGSRHEL